MFKRKDKKKPEEAESKPSAKSGGETAPVKTSGWDETTVKVKSRSFPGPAGASEALRITMTKESYADLIGHAKESVDREICGVLLGFLCEDEYGFFVSVEAAIRGSAAKTGGTHVTFTQETWNAIHKEKEERFPKLQIVGWYHSHPGFGVEFSDMDLFIQKNFFSGPSQIAFVSDPLGGEEAICANTDDGIKNIRRFWVDGRERRCYTPRSDQAAAASTGNDKTDAPALSAAPMTAPNDILRAIEKLEDRVRQLTDAAEKQRNTFYNFLTFVGILTALAIIGGLGYSLYQAYTGPYTPPKEISESGQVAQVQLDGKPTLVAIKAVKWQIPDELGYMMVNRAQWEAMDERLQKAIAAGTQPDMSQVLGQANESWWIKWKWWIMGGLLLFILLSLIWTWRRDRAQQAE